MPLAKTTRAEELRQRLAFSKRGVAVDDGYGNVQSEFETQFTVQARVRPRLGGEEVLAARLTGKNIVAITVRYSSQTKQIEADWVATDARSGEVYNIRSAVPDERKIFMEILGERGVVA